MKHFKNQFYVLAFALVAMLFVQSCGTDETTPTPEPKSRFTPVQSATDPLTYTFTNESTDATSFAWSFGDGELSTDEEPTHTYATSGTFNVVLVVTGAGGTATSNVDVIVVDPNTELKKLTGATSKTWKLARQGVALRVFPSADPATTWWSFGQAEPFSARPCLLTDEYIFSLDGKYEYKGNGSVWAEGGIWEKGPGCVDETDASNFKNVDGADISKWKSGVHTFEFKPTEAKLKVIGLGAFIGLSKVSSTDGDVKVPQPFTEYGVRKLVEVENGVDTLVIFATFDGGAGTWEYSLLHYDNPLDEPGIPLPPGEKPLAVKDIFDAFDADGTMTWTADGAIALDQAFANPLKTGINTSALCAKYTDTEQPYSNIQFELDFRMDLSTRNKFTVLVKFPGTHSVNLKLQDTKRGGDLWKNQAAIPQMITSNDEWVLVTFDFNQTLPTLADEGDVFPPTMTVYDKIVLQFGGEGDAQEVGEYLFDDLKLL